MENLSDMLNQASSIEERVEHLSFILGILKSLQTEYGHKTLDNIIQGLEANVKYLNKTNVELNNN